MTPYKTAFSVFLSITYGSITVQITNSIHNNTNVDLMPFPSHNTEHRLYKKKKIQKQYILYMHCSQGAAAN